MFRFLIIFSILFHVVSYAKSIDDKTEFYDLLSYSQIYIDHTKTMVVEDMITKDKEFKANDKKLLGYGYSPDFNVWVKFTLTNSTSKSLNKILEYDNSLTTYIDFFDISSNTYKEDGLFQIDKNRKTINPTFKIQLAPNETKTYYIKASSYITTLIVKLNLWDSDSFYEKEIKHQLILALFFGAMFVLAIYNLFIYFFTKDVSYLYYVMYIFGIIAHHLIYVGIGQVYLLNQQWNIYIIEFASLLIAFPIYALALFTKSFLHIKNYTINNTILNIFLILIPLSIFVFIFTDIVDKYRNILPVLLSIYLIFLTIYSTLKKNRQAYFILFGWFVIFISIIVMNLSSAGIFNIYQYFPYIIETAFVLEAIVFSIALADRIKQLQKEKNEANHKLLEQEQNEKERLTIQVDEKTKDLQEALGEKKLLLKELNHRVKNNMQTIVSLIRLQSDDIEDEKLQDIFTTVQNRINAMSHLHELLYNQDNISFVDAHRYFEVLIEELKDSYENDIEINLDIDVELKMEQAIYCGLILNELITNAFKYAFPVNDGRIDISLKKIENMLVLNIVDDGIGYVPSPTTNSLGLVLVETLAQKQLNGDLRIDSSNGTNITIVWSNDG